MKELYLKIANCKKHIKMSPLKKIGRNTFSNYDYFAPQQIEQLVFEACEKEQLLTIFSTKRDEYGMMGFLDIISLESGEKIQLTMATDIPLIKATNTAQQIGGCVTYTERYLKMTAFGIVENSLDFDGLKPEEPETPETIRLKGAILEMKNSKSLDEVKNIWIKYKDLQTNVTFSIEKENLKKNLTKK